MIPQLFGQTAQGHAVHAITLSAGDLCATILTYGAALQDVRLAGVAHGLTLGLASVAEYEAPGGGYAGTIVGPVANRLTGAAAPLGDKVLRLVPNEGPNLLHSGAAGLHARLWRIDAATEAGCTLSLTLADGEDGFPGNRLVQARWTVQPPATLRLDLTIASDAPTLVNLANHSFWNLDGSPTWAGHSLQIDADHVLPVDAALLPTGHVSPVDGDLDFRQLRKPLPDAPALDHNFCLAPSRRALTPVARLVGASGLCLKMATTEPGLQVYDGRGPFRPGRAGYEGLALEAQVWPDAPNQAAFPPILHGPDAPYHQTTLWTFQR